jgi:hypothetical protein
MQAGVSAQVTVRGVSLAGARALLFAGGAGGSACSARVLSIGREDPKADPPVDLVRLELNATGADGNCPFRLVAAQGVTNELPLRAVAEPLVDEASPGAAPLAQFPVSVTGRIAARGEVDDIWIQANAGETFTFTASGGTAAFDPALELAEPSGSWFDQGRLNRIAFNDEPLHFPGLANDARLVHRFEKAGKFALRVRAFSGQGGPDFTYHLRIARGIGQTPLLHPKPSPVWDERRFTRRLADNWIPLLAARGGRELGREFDGRPPAAAFRASALDTEEPPVMTAPGVVEGRIGKPAETHRIKLRIDKPQDLAIEVETPEATMPRFNPVVRLLAPGGDRGGDAAAAEVVTNVYTKRNNNGLYMMKMIQAKSTVTLRSAGDYLMEIRDITTDLSSDDFAYRILVRPQIPHVGKVEVPEDRINLEPGQAKPITIIMEREEGFSGLVLASAEGLPPGVTATAGMANPVDKPPLPNGGRLERYAGKPQTSTLLLTASPDAAASELPSTVRVLLRTVRDGRLSDAIAVKELPVMVIPRRPS